MGLKGLKMQMNCLPENRVIQTIEKTGANIRHIQEIEWGKPDWRCLVYYIVKPNKAQQESGSSPE